MGGENLEALCGGGAGRRRRGERRPKGTTSFQNEEFLLLLFYLGEEVQVPLILVGFTEATCIYGKKT